MKSLLTLSLLLFSFCLSAQTGKLMLVGGGSELDTDYSWSNTPYQWAVGESSNKKVAIITYNLTGDEDWLPNYFESLGAVEATNFEISTREMANTPEIYTDLMSYDVFFFKGGDQAQYYDLYKNTQVSQAIEDKFAEGGVISGTSAGMAILSEVIFTAEEGSIFPDQTLNNINDPDLILRDDFVNILDDYIVDTHFIERGRFARLMTFMGHWINQSDNIISGIGVDDRTAFCIDSQGIGTAYGTGAVSIYHTESFDTDEGRPKADDILTVQLLHEASYNLNNRTLNTDYTTPTSATVNEENGNYRIYLTGSEPINHNTAMLEEFIASAEANLVVISRENTGLAITYINYIEANSDLQVEHIITRAADECEEVELRNFIRDSKTFLFVDNDSEELMDFIENTTTGQVLKTQLFRNENVMAFIGDDASLAGAKFSTNNRSDELNAYRGQLQYTDGIGLLQTSIIMSNTFDPSSTTFYENNSAAVQFALIQERLKYGLYLNERSFATFYSEDGQNFLTSTGNHSSALMINNSDFGGIANQQVNAAGDVRNVVGFDKVQYALISNQSIQVGTTAITNDPEIEYELLAPKSLMAVGNDVSVTLTWEVDESTHDGLKLFRKEGDEAFQLLTTLSPEATTYVDEEVEKSTNYVYKLITTLGDLSSCFSNESEVTIITALFDRDKNVSFSIFPNPTKNGEINIKGFQSARVLEIKLIDLSGQLIYQYNTARNERKVILPRVKPGVYLFSIRDENRIENHKIVINYEE